VAGRWYWGSSKDGTGACPACPVASENGTGVAPEDGIRVNNVP